MSNINLKTFVPALVGAGVLVFEASTGHVLDKNVVSQITNGALTVAGLVVTIIGFVKDHKKPVPTPTTPQEVKAQ